MEIVQLINSIYSSNTYVLTLLESEGCWLVDCGDADEIEAWLMQHNKTLKGVFLTHTHYDHIYGLNALKELHPMMRVFTSQNGITSLQDDRYNFSRYHNVSFTYQTHDVEMLQEGDLIEIFPNQLIRVMETPGHDWSCLSYRMDHALFSGDSYIPGLRVVTTFPKGNKKLAEMSLQRILACMDDDITIYAGHGDTYRKDKIQQHE
jgi:glyoxylase-like metal-dependent hydrolase (beta-lactamase superfamily II)